MNLAVWAGPGCGDGSVAEDAPGALQLLPYKVSPISIHMRPLSASKIRKKNMGKISTMPSSDDSLLGALGTGTHSTPRETHKGGEPRDVGEAKVSPHVGAAGWQNGFSGMPQNAETT